MKKSKNTILIIVVMVALLFMSMPQSVSAQTESETLSENLLALGIDVEDHSNLIAYYNSTGSENTYLKLLGAFSDMEELLYGSGHLIYLSDLKVTDIEVILAIVQGAADDMQVKIKITDLDNNSLSASEILQKLWDDRDINNIQVVISQLDDTYLGTMNLAFANPDTIEMKLPILINTAADTIKLVDEGVLPDGYIAPATPTPPATATPAPTATPPPDASDDDPFLPPWAYGVMGVALIALVIVLVPKGKKKDDKKKK